MRNSWYPRQKAKYMTEPTSDGLKPQKIVAERDFTFGMKQEEPKEKPLPMKPKEIDRPVEVQTKLLPVCVFWQNLEAERRLTMYKATTSFRNLRDVPAPESHLLQNSYKRPGTRNPHSRPACRTEKSRQFSRCRTRGGVCAFAKTRSA